MPTNYGPMTFRPTNHLLPLGHVTPQPAAPPQHHHQQQVATVSPPPASTSRQRGAPIAAATTKTKTTTTPPTTTKPNPLNQPELRAFWESYRDCARYAHEMLKTQRQVFVERHPVDAEAERLCRILKPSRWQTSLLPLPVFHDGTMNRQNHHYG